MKVTPLKILAWSLTLTVSLVAIIAWGNLYAWQLGSLTTYQYFPLLGLLAFSIMWAHYIMSAVRQYTGIEQSALAGYFRSTAWVVLFTILLHPSLLILQLLLDGKGFPPFSYYRYVGPAGKMAVTLGTIAFTFFLAYELWRWFRDRGWWKYVQYASDIGMLMILYHSLSLGSHLQSGWLRQVWLFYGVTYVLALGYSYLKRNQAA